MGWGKTGRPGGTAGAPSHGWMDGCVDGRKDGWRLDKWMNGRSIWREGDNDGHIQGLARKGDHRSPQQSQPAPPPTEHAAPPTWCQ